MSDLRGWTVFARSSPIARTAFLELYHVTCKPMLGRDPFSS